MGIASFQQPNLIYISKWVVLKRWRRKRTRNKEKCLKGYCVISLVTQPEPGVHTSPISYNKPWEEIRFSSSLRKFGHPGILNQILWDTATSCEGNWVWKGSGISLEPGSLWMSLSSPELEHWISEYWQLLLNNEGFITWGWTPTNQAPVGVRLCKGNPSASICCNSSLPLNAMALLKCFWG